MTPIRVTCRPDETGAIVVELQCRCLTVRRHLTSWEDREPAAVQLLVEHMRQAPRCPHGAPDLTILEVHR